MIVNDDELYYSIDLTIIRLILMWSAVKADLIIDYYNYF